MKDGVIADFDITEAMLRHFILSVHNRRTLVRPRIIVSVPSGVTQVERRAVRETVESAGAREIYLIEEPMAAAIGAGLPIEESQGNFICDIGGGTTDAAVISLGGIVASASFKCAGDKINQAIADYIKKNFNLFIGDRTAEDIKIKIGSAVLVDEEMVYKIKGRDFLTGLPRTAEITTNEVVKAIDSELKDMMKVIKNVLQETPPELSSDIIDNGITMTGGSSLLRNIDELVFRSTGVKAHVADDALLCVAKGAGLALDHLDTYKKSIIAKK